MGKSRENPLTFRLVPGSYAICRLAPAAAVPSWADRAPFCSLTRTSEELSIVCPAGAVPATLAAEGGRVQDGWALLQLVGPFPFSTVGICAEISGALAGGGISLIALATFDTDYFLVQEADLPRALEALTAAGHLRHEPAPAPGRPEPQRVAATVLAALLCLLAPSTRATDPVPEPAPSAETGGLVPLAIDPPAPAGSILPALATEGATTFNRDDDILLTWLEPGERGGRLMFSRYSGASWSAPVTVAAPVAQIHPADDASLSVIETQGPRRTLLARTGDAIFRSPDAGRAWTALTGPKLPFSSFASGEEGAFVFWLSGERNATKLLGTRVLAGQTVLDPEVSATTVTAAAMTWDGPIVVYRDGGAGASRLAVVRRENARWTAPSPLAGSDGQPSAHPDSGPRLGVAHRQVAAAWVAETPAGARLRVAFSADAGRSFGEPVELHQAAGAPEPAGPLAVAVDDDGQAFVLWKSSTKAEATLQLARVSGDGRQSAALVLARVPAIHLRGRPQLVRANDRLAASWTEGVLARVRVSLIPITEVPPLEKRPATSPASSTVYTGRGRAGDPAPGLALVSLAGEPVSLPRLRGNAVLLNLWATWCVPCIGEMPELAALHQKHGAAGLSVVGVNVDDERRTEIVRRFVAERALPFAVWLDPAMFLPRALRVPALPATFVLDREGKILLRLERPITAADPELERALERALAKP